MTYKRLLFIKKKIIRKII